MPGCDSMRSRERAREVRAIHRQRAAGRDTRLLRATSKDDAPHRRELVLEQAGGGVRVLTLERVRADELAQVGRVMCGGAATTGRISISRTATPRWRAATRPRSLQDRRRSTVTRSCNAIFGRLRHRSPRLVADCDAVQCSAPRRHPQHTPYRPSRYFVTAPSPSSAPIRRPTSMMSRPRSRARSSGRAGLVLIAASTGSSPAREQLRPPCPAARWPERLSKTARSSLTSLTGIAPWLRSRLEPVHSGAKIEPGTTMTSRPACKRVVRRDERAAAEPGLHHQQRTRQTGDDPVSCPKRPFRRRMAPRRARRSPHRIGRSRASRRPAPRGYTTSAPQPSTATVRPPASRAARCAACRNPRRPPR